MLHSLTLLGAIFLQLMRFIRNHQVSIICNQFLLQSPCTLVIHDNDLQSLIGQFSQLLLFLCRRTFQNGQRIMKICEFFKFLFPNPENGKRSNYQYTIYFAVLIHTSCNGNTDDGFAGTHFHKQRCASALEPVIENTEFVTGKSESLLLMVIWCCLDWHHQFNIFTHCSHLAFP